MKGIITCVLIGDLKLAWSNFKFCWRTGQWFELH